MSKFFHIRILKAFAFSAICLCALPLAAQTPTDPRARITFADESSRIIHGHRRGNEISFPLVEVLAGEQVQIQVRLPSQFANMLVTVQASDGGSVSGGGVVGADGTSPIGFQAGTQPGRYRVLLSAGTNSAVLNFSVSHPQNP